MIKKIILTSILLLSMRTYGATSSCNDYQKNTALIQAYFEQAIKDDHLLDNINFPEETLQQLALSIQNEKTKKPNNYYAAKTILAVISLGLIAYGASKLLSKKETVDHVRPIEYKKPTRPHEQKSHPNNGDVLITLVYGNMLEQKFDCTEGNAAIVNAANEPMLGGGGIDGQISIAGGPGLARERAAVPAVNGIRCPTGQARLTNGYGLNGREYRENITSEADRIKIIHTVGPDLRNPQYGTHNNQSYTGYTPREAGEQALNNAYTNSLTAADANTLSASNSFLTQIGIPQANLTTPITTIAFPCISTSIFRYPMDEAFTQALNAIVTYFTQHQESTIKEVRFVVFGPGAYNTYKTNLERDNRLMVLPEQAQAMENILLESSTEGSRHQNPPSNPLCFTLQINE